MTMMWRLLGVLVSDIYLCSLVTSDFSNISSRNSSTGFVGFANVYAMRVNLSVAIVYMAGEKGMAWKESQQGFILGEI